MNKTAPQNNRDKFIKLLDKYFTYACSFGEVEYRLTLVKDKKERRELEGRGTGLLNGLLCLTSYLISYFDGEEVEDC